MIQFLPFVICTLGHFPSFPFTRNDGKEWISISVGTFCGRDIVPSVIPAPVYTGTGSSGNPAPPSFQRRQGAGIQPLRHSSGGWEREFSPSVIPAEAGSGNSALPSSQRRLGAGIQPLRHPSGGWDPVLKEILIQIFLDSSLRWNDGRKDSRFHGDDGEGEQN